MSNRFGTAAMRFAMAGMVAALGSVGNPSATQAANLLINGSFEVNVLTAADNCGVGALWCERSFASTPGWTQILDGVDLTHNNYTQGPPVLVDASDGVQFLDMNQAGLLGGIEQVVAASTGATYRLTLDSTAWATNSIGGTLGYQLYDPASSIALASGSFTDNVGGTWVTRGLAARAISSSVGVRIQGLVATQAGMGLDNVALALVPEPQTYALMLAGLGVLGAVIRSRNGSR